MTTDEHSASKVIDWLRACNTQAQLKRVWNDELTNYSKMLPGVLECKDEMKEKLR